MECRSGVCLVVTFEGFNDCVVWVLEEKVLAPFAAIEVSLTKFHYDGDPVSLHPIVEILDVIHIEARVAYPTVHLSDHIQFWVPCRSGQKELQVDIADLTDVYLFPYWLGVHVRVKLLEAKILLVEVLASLKILNANYYVIYG